MKYLKFIFLSLILSSCSFMIDVCQYDGVQIVNKSSDSPYWFQFRYKGTITSAVNVCEYDWNMYNIGDTVKCNK